MRAVLLLFALLLGSLPVAANAQANLPGLSDGVEYRYIPNGQPYRQLPPGMVEVAEVFAYTCPHCAHFEPMLKAWSAKLPAHARLVLVPAVFGRDDAWSRAYFAAEASHALPVLHHRLFAAIHETGALPHNATVAQIEQFAVRVPGIDAAKFRAALHDDAALLRKLRHAYEYSQSSGVEGTPTLIVAGRYMILGNSYESLLANARRVIDALAPRRHPPAARPATSKPH